MEEEKVYSGPPASRLTLLSNLGNIPPGQKVRFLGWFSRREIPATLSLVHDHPTGHGLEASVDVDLLLTTLKSSDTQQGEWVHVIGYIKDRPINVKRKESKQISIQAIVLWSACPLKLDEYEQSIDARDAYDSKNE